MLVKTLIMAVVGASIGWFTNKIAIKMLFRPKTPIIIPLVNLQIQGLIPRRRQEIASSIGAVVEKELVSIEEIVIQLSAQKNRIEILRLIKTKIRDMVKEKLPGFLPTTVKDIIINYVNDTIDQQGGIIINELAERIIHKATTELKLRQMVENKINHFELDRLENIILTVAGKELKHIEYLGAVIGFFIGLGQALIIYLIG